MQFSVQFLDSLATEIHARCGTAGLAAVLVDRSGVLWEACRGWADFAAPVPVSPCTRFAVASATKSFTAAAVLRLQSRGVLHINDPVRLYLPWFRLSDPEVSEHLTVADLLSHGAGFGWHDALWYNTDLSRTDLLRRMRHVALAKPFRNSFSYSNVTYIAAGEVVAAVAGCPYESYLKNEVLRPLGMTTAGFSAGGPRWALPYASSGSSALEALRAVSVAKANAAIGLTASIYDLGRWLDCLLHGGRPPLAPGDLHHMWSPHTTFRCSDDRRIWSYFGLRTRLAYGLGWFLSDHAGLAIASHTGSLPGYRSHIAVLPEAGLALAVLSNTSLSFAPEILIYSILDRVAGTTPTDWFAHYAEVSRLRLRWEDEEEEAPAQPCGVPCPPAGSLPGLYRNPAYGEFQIADAGDRLHFAWARYRGWLEPFGGGRFLLRGVDCPLLGEDCMLTASAADASGCSCVRFLGQDFDRADTRESEQTEGLLTQGFPAFR
jgi:CubicO group peptidase (beta-lactamase class C family)